MYTYLRNIGPLFFMKFSFSQKFESLIISFDGSSALAYSSHILWSWPLGEIWHQHTSFSTNLFLKGFQLCLTFSIFLEEESWSQPYVFWWIAPPPQFDHVYKCSIWDFLRDEAMWKKIWLFTRSCFHEKILEFQSYSEKSFWCLFKTNLFWKIQAILMNRFAWVLKFFLFCFWWS